MTDEARLLQDLLLQLDELITRAARLEKPFYDFAGVSDLVAIADEIERIRCQTGVRRFLTLELAGEPLGDTTKRLAPNALSFKVWDPVAKTKGVHGGLANNITGDPVLAQSNRLNLPTFLDYLNRARRYIDQRISLLSKTAMTGSASRATFNLHELQMNVATPSDEERDAILELDDDAFKAELEKYVVRGWVGGAVDSKPTDFGSASYCSQLTSEGSRLVAERHEKRNKPIRDAWRPDDISEADQYAEPLRTVVAFRLLCGQYVAIAGNSMELLKDHWKRSKLCDIFLPMADGVAAAINATNEDPKGFFRALALCNETDRHRFIGAWSDEILPTLRTVEIKLNETLKKPKRPNPHRGTLGELWVAIACEIRSGEPMPGALAEHWKDTWRHRLWERYGHGLSEFDLFDKWQGYAAVYFGVHREGFLATRLSDADRLLPPLPGGTAATSDNEQPEADSVPAIGTSGDEKIDVVATPATVVQTDNRKAGGKAGGRPRKKGRTPEERKVLKYRDDNPKTAWCDIDDHFELPYGESLKIYERVRKRERNTSPGDKMGQN